MTTGIDEAACARARDAIAVARRAEHGLLRAVAELDERGVASASGYRSLRRLVEDLWHVNPARARRLVAQAALLVPTVSLTGQPSPPVTGAAPSPAAPAGPAAATPITCGTGSTAGPPSWATSRCSAGTTTS